MPIQFYIKLKAVLELENVEGFRFGSSQKPSPARQKMEQPTKLNKGTIDKQKATVSIVKAKHTKLILNNFNVYV